MSFWKRVKHFFTDSWSQRVHAAQRWVARKLMSDSDDSAAGESTEVESNPTIDGVKNTSGSDKVIPLVLGKTKLSPFYCANPYRTISGDDGATQTYHALFMLGYRNIDVSDIKLGQIDLSSGNTGKTGAYVDSFGDAEPTDRTNIVKDSTGNIFVELTTISEKPKWVWADYRKTRTEDLSGVSITGAGYGGGAVRGSTCSFSVDGEEHTLVYPAAVYIPVSSSKGSLVVRYKGDLKPGTVATVQETRDNVVVGYESVVICGETYETPVTKNCVWNSYSVSPDGICSVSDISADADGTTSATFSYSKAVRLEVNGTTGKYVRLLASSAEILSYKEIGAWEQAGELPVDGRWDASEYNIHLELRNGANPNRADGEVALYSQKVNEEELNIELEHISDSGDTAGTGIMLADRVSARNPQKVQVEFLLNGLFMSYEGKRLNATVQICIQYSLDGGQTYKNFGPPRINADNAANTWKNEGARTLLVHGKSITADVYTLTGNKTKDVRYVAERTFTYDEAINARNRYIEIRVFRYNVKGVDVGSVSYTDTITLSSIRTWCYDYTKSLEAGELVPQAPLIKSKRDITARLAFQVDADRNEFKSQLNELNCILTSKCRTCERQTDENGDTVYKWSDELSPSQNPASVALMLLQHESRGQYAYSDDQLDLQSFGRLFFHCAEMVSYRNTVIPRFSCNGALTSQAKTSAVLSDILSTCRARYVLHGKKYGVWIDTENDKVAYLFNAQNVLSSNISKEFAELTDGVKVSFVNEDGNYSKDTMTVLYDDAKAGEPNLSYQTLEMKYQTAPAQIFSNAKYYLADRKLRCESITLKVSVDGNLLRLGDKVGVQLESMSTGIGEGVLAKEILANSSGNITRIEVDGRVSLEDYDLHGDKFMAAINQTGGDRVSVGVYPAVPVLDSFGFVRYLEFPQPIQAGSSYPAAGDVISIGTTEDYKTQKIYAECLVFGKKDNGDGTFSLTLSPYQPAIYTADKYASIPEFDSKVTLRQDSTYFNPKTASPLDVANAVADALSGSSAYSGAPSDPGDAEGKAYRDYIELSCTPPDTKDSGNKLSQSVSLYVWELKKGGEAEYVEVARTSSSSCIYSFKRDEDGYPEKSDLSSWNVRVKCTNIYGVDSGYASGTIGTDGYKTWLAPAVDISSLTAGKDRLTCSWSLNSSLTYGDVRCRVEFLYDGAVIKTVPQALASSASYDFDRDFDKDGYPERTAVNTQLRELGIATKGRDIESYSVRVSSFTLQRADFTRPVSMSCGGAGYGTWVPGTGRSLSVKASQNGLSVEAEGTPLPSEYGAPYSYEYGIRKAEDGKWTAYTSDSPIFDYAFTDEYPEAEDLLGWTVRCRAVSTAGIPALYYKSASPDVASYGTWKLRKPEVVTRVSDRTITLIMSLPESSAEQYGTTRYRLRIRRPGYDRDGEWFKPGKTLDPYGSEDNYKDGSGYIETGNVYVQTLPLAGQSGSKLSDTLYQFSVTAVNEAYESEANDSVFETALCTSIKDIVKANETAKEAYITKLSAISANIGTIKQGSLSGNDRNFWNLSTFVDEETGIKRWQGAMRVGGDDQYLEVVPIIRNEEIAGYDITFKVGNFEISSTASNINGELVIQRDGVSLDRTRITPLGTFYEHRETASSEWSIISRMSTEGILTSSVFSGHSLVLTNISIQDRRLIGHDIGRRYLSSGSRVWHFDTDMNDQNQTTDLAVSSYGEVELVGYGTQGELDYTPAILSVAPYSEIARSLFGQYQISRQCGKTSSLTVDFWIQYIWCENQILFDIGTANDRASLTVMNTEVYWNTPLDGEPVWNNESRAVGDVVVWNVPAPASTTIRHYGKNTLSLDADNVRTLSQLGIKFEPNSWLHIGIVLSDSKLTVLVNRTAVDFARYEKSLSDADIILNKDGDTLKNTFVLDELLIDESACEERESFFENTDARIPWGMLDYKEKHFIVDGDNIKTNLLDGIEARLKALEEKE